MTDKLDFKEEKITIRSIQYEDIPTIVALAQLGFANPDIAYEEQHYENHIHVFPEGQICVLYEEMIIGTSSSIIIHYEDFGDDHVFDDISKGGYINNHMYDGTHLYGLDIVVHPDYRKLKIGRRLYQERQKLCRQFNLKSIIIGGRMPHYHQYADMYTASEYVERVRLGEIFDPVLVFQMNNGFQVRSVNAHYLKNDTDSLEYAAIMEWKNDAYRPQDGQNEVPANQRKGVETIDE